MSEPTASAGASDPLNRLIAEFLERREHGEEVDSKSFAAAHGEHAAGLRSFFESVEVLERAGGRGRAATVLQPEEAGPRPASMTSSKRNGVDDTATRLPNAAGAAAVPPSLPQQFGRYQIVRLLGQGGMGAVYLARDTQLKRDVALKIPTLAGPDSDELVQRFQREAQAAATLRHPHICPVFDVGEIGGIHYLTMAFIKGRNLEKFIDPRKPQNQRVVGTVIRKLALALAEAHRHGIVHRDLKPANVMIDDQNEPVVMDFGLARQVAGPTDVHLTQSGMLVGTPAYMSPEQIAGDPARIGPQCDIWSLGVMFFEMLTGRLPFEGNMMQVIGAIQHTDPPPPSTVRKGINPRLEGICLKMLARDPEQRYPNMQEVARVLGAVTRGKGQTGEAIDALEGDEEVSAVAAPPPPASKKAHARPATAAGRKPAARKPSRGPNWRSLVLAVGGGLLGLLLLWGVITLIFRNGDVAMQVELDESLKDENITFTLDGNAYSISNLGQTIKVKPGPHLLDVQRGDERFKTDEFTITRKEKPVLRITLLDRKLTVMRDSNGSATPLAGAHTPPWKTAGKPWHDWPADAPAPAIAPFTVAEARQHQEAWAKYLGIGVEYTNSVGMKFRLIPPGEYRRGSPDSDDMALRSEWPQHEVHITKPFYLGVCEVTQGDWTSVMRTEPWKNTAIAKGKNHPVTVISWVAAQAFCAELSRKEGRTCRLPTEGEWECACRAGTTTRFHFGDDPSRLSEFDWILEGTLEGSHAFPVGQKKSNPFGLFDLHGNMFEYCSDPYRETEYGQFAKRAAVDPQGAPESETRVYRSGAFDAGPRAVRSTYRGQTGLDNLWTNVGLRVVVDVDRNGLTEESTRDSLVPAPSSKPADAPPKAIAPFTAAEAKQHQEAWAKYLGVDVEYKNPIGMKFRLIPPGEFMMGSSPEEIAELVDEVKRSGMSEAAKVALDECLKSEAPRHKVILTRPIYLGVHEVTQSQYQKVMGHNPSAFASTGMYKDQVTGIDTANYPVDMVTWKNAADFCVKLSRQQNLKPSYVATGDTVALEDGDGYRLPTEAEWEFSCRAGTTTRFWIGDKDEDLLKAGWFNLNGNRMHPVGESKDNPFELFDVHGNVVEFTQDYWSAASYQEFETKPAVDPRGAGPTLPVRRVMRSGDSILPGFQCRSSMRVFRDESTTTSFLGFRVALAVPDNRSGKSIGASREEAPKEKSRDRVAAEYVLARRGSVILRKPGQTNLPEPSIASKSELPPDPWTLVSVYFRPQEDPQGKMPVDFSAFRGLETLQNLFLTGPRYADPEIHTLPADMPALRHLSLVGTGITDEAVALLPEYPSLESIRLQENALTPKCLKKLAKYPRLQGLTVLDLLLTDEGVDALRECPKLNYIATNADDAILERLKKLRLETLTLVADYGRPMHFTRAGLVHLKAMPALTTLSIYNHSISSRESKVLQELLPLTSLTIDQSRLSRERRMSLDDVEQLRKSLPDCRVTVPSTMSTN